MEGKAEEYLRSDDMITLLNSNNEEENIWIKDSKNINKGFPILDWQR